ncbi:MAG: hypothetical protein LBR37_00830, partial [Erysipelotrichaceae bacterium]|nr:hypothetical protein [Erysipelotrichaceae bacterium]
MRKLFIILSTILAILGVILVIVAGKINIPSSEGDITLSFLDSLFGTVSEGVVALKGDPKLSVTFIASIAAIPFMLITG